MPATSANIDLLYALDDKPPFFTCLSVAFQHVLACFIGIVTPTLIIGSVLNLGEDIPFLISMALIASGIGSFIQTRQFGPFGSGLVTIQGTSFAFISALIIAGSSVRAEGGSNADIMSLVAGLTITGALVEILVAFFIDNIKRVITPVTTGIVITAIGLSLIKVGMTDFAGGFYTLQQDPDNFGSLSHLAVGLTVVLTIVFLNATSNRWLRLSAIFMGMLAGTVVAFIQGNLHIQIPDNFNWLVLPNPLQYGVSFDLSLFAPVVIIYFFSAIETAGDLTANSVFCQQPTQGKRYMARIRGGIMADGINSIIAGVLCSFPNTTFGQNNGVIQLTGVASRKIGFFVAALLVLLGLFPIIGLVLQSLPKPVIGGATLIMFGMVAAGGIRVLTHNGLNRIQSLIVATALGAGMGVMLVPEALNQLPLWAKNLLASPVTTSGIVAISLTLLLEKRPASD